jgi:cell division protein ZapA
MEKSISVRVMGRDYTLRVNAHDEALTREVAAYVDTKMMAFRAAFPKQPEITTAVIAALAIAEELFSARHRQDALLDQAEKELDSLSDILGEMLELPTNGQAESSESEK